MVLSTILITLMFFQDEEVIPEPEPLTPVQIGQIMEQAKTAFNAQDFQKAIYTLQPAVDQYIGEAMLLAADANYGLHTPRSLRRARTLYERCIYEDNKIPFSDHSQYQAAQIYFWEAERAREEGDDFHAARMEEEADFYLSRLIRTKPNSYYRDLALDAMLNLAVNSGNFDKVMRRVDMIWSTSTDPWLLTRAEPFTFIQQEPFNASLAQLSDTYARHESSIHLVPELMTNYAQAFEDAGDLAKASELFLLNYNLWPKQDDGASSLLRLADLHRRQQDWEGAAFLYERIMEDYAEDLPEARAALGLALMVESGNIFDIEVNKVKLSYPDLIEKIRFSLLPVAERAQFSYKLALFQSRFGNLEQALLVMRNLLDEYQRGPYVGLYRDFYEKLLFRTVEKRYDRGLYWDLDRLYRQHRQLLAFTTQTRYPDLVAKAYLALDLPTSAMQVYEAMWDYKRSLSGFDLAFEEPFNDYLFLLNYMRKDDRLRSRLSEYNDLYTNRDRFFDRYHLVRTLYDSRTMEPEAFLEQVDTGQLQSIFDARRLRRIAIIAQENNDFDLADDLYARALQWRPMKQDLPGFWQEARLYQADRTFSLGNYFDAETKYRAIYSSEDFPHTERDWAYLQIARLHELKGEVKPSVRIYGQIAYSPAEHSEAYRVFATRRLAAIAAIRQLDDTEKELELGSF